MKVVVIPILNGALGTIPKALLKELEDLGKENYWRLLILQQYQD